MSNIEQDALLACSDAVGAALGPLALVHDSRLLFACIVAEGAYIGGLLRTGKIYTPETIARVFAEAMVTALTRETKTPKIFYSDGEDTMERKQ